MMARGEQDDVDNDDLEEEEEHDVEDDDVEEEDRSAHSLCEPAQAKSTWTKHKKNFMR